MQDASPSQQPVPSTMPKPPDARAWYVLGALCFVYVLNFLDRQLLSILAKPIQDDLGVTDGQLGLISGLYFAMFYCSPAPGAGSSSCASRTPTPSGPRRRRSR